MTAAFIVSSATAFGLRTLSSEDVTVTLSVPLPSPSTQAEVNAQTEALAQAIGALVLRADKTALKDAIDNNTEVATLENFENDYIRKVVDKCHGNISRAAEMLGITRQTLYAKLKR